MKKKPESWGESNPWPPEHWVGMLSNELGELMKGKVIYWVHIDCILHTARITTVEFVMSVISE